MTPQGRERVYALRYVADRVEALAAGKSAIRLRTA
jgi:hypothetical protein